MTMDANEGSHVTAKDAFREFSRFFALHPENFPKEVRQRLLDTSAEITKIFKADNPLDNVYLVALKDMFSMENTQKI
jgi:hypothetical protein